MAPETAFWLLGLGSIRTFLPWRLPLLVALSQVPSSRKPSLLTPPAGNLCLTTRVLIHEVNKYLLSTWYAPGTCSCLWGIKGKEQSREINTSKDSKCYGENKAERLSGEEMSRGGANGQFRQVVSTGDIYVQRHEGGEVRSHEKYLGKNFPGRWTCKSQSPEAGIFLGPATWCPFIYGPT